MFFDEFDKYIQSLPKLSKVKFLILETLWKAGEDFPRDWVQSSHLLQLTNQKYFDRRVRELRDELGCDIETGNHKSEAAYRLLSDKVGGGNPRYYLSEKQKRELFQRERFRCRVCGAKVEPGPRGLQADHKVPLNRGGSHGDSNWQSLCNDCNVGKRRACQGCEEDCQQCVWAFPERVGMIHALKLPHELLEKLNKAGFHDPAEIDEVIIESLNRRLSG
jgi:5-methylcytosine-specific restriction endonuclease McrA